MNCSMRLRTFASVFALSSVSLFAAHAQTANGAPCPTAPVGDHGQAANGKPLASPAAQTQVSLSGKTIAIHYNAPSKRCRTVMGELVPYGKVWRTGANPATSFTSTSDLKIGDLLISAGKYTLYTLPEAPGTPWQLILNKQTGQWGTEYHPEQDFGRVPMHAETLAKTQETMSISFEKTTATTTQLHVKWENVDEWVEIRLAK